jgi:signal transduction histidine kinase
VDADLVTVIRYVNVVVFGGVSLAALRLHRSLRSPRSRWLFATFATVAVVTFVSLLLPSDPTVRSGLDDFVGDVLIAILLLFPYCLYRFTAAFDAGPRWVLHTLHATIALLVLAAFVLPPQAPAPAPTTPAYSAFVAAVLAYWTVLSLWVVVRMWRGGRGQPSVARRRMRLLAAATLLFNIGLLIAAGRNEPGSALALTTTALVWISAGVFYLGFAPPSPLRHAWRQDDERRLRQAEADLMSATTPEEVAETILPRVADLLGGHGAALIDPEGVPLAVQGFTSEQVSDISAGQHTEHDETIERDRLVLHLRSGGSLVVQASAYAPFFGDEELDLLRSLATFVDLALSRIGLYEQERRTAKELRRTNDELVALVYGISHDLRSPIVTVIGYLELLQADSAEHLDEEGRHYLERISVSARYMDSLIRDLLELSRIGRTQTETEPVQLQAIIEDIAAELRRTHQQARFEVGDLPDVVMNPVRARQLFTNLMENAVRHGGRDDITIRVSASPGGSEFTSILVADDGAGIPPQYRERVFGIFERLDQEADTATIGTGIGLSMCRKIVEQFDGALTIDDTESGTTFRISLPSAVTQSQKEVQRQ